MSLDLPAIQALLVEMHDCDEKIADRGPIKVLPRPSGEVPDVPKLKARIQEIEHRLRVKRTNTTKAQGHDLNNEGQSAGYDLTAVGIVEEVRSIPKGRDRALPKATTIVRVRFPSGEHLWFDPAALVPGDAKK